MVSVDEVVELLRQPGRTTSHAASNCSRTDRVRHHPHHLQHGHQLARRQGLIQVNKGPFINYVTHLKLGGGQLCVTKCHRGGVDKCVM